MFYVTAHNQKINILLIFKYLFTLKTIRYIFKFCEFIDLKIKFACGHSLSNCPIIRRVEIFESPCWFSYSEFIEMVCKKNQKSSAFMTNGIVPEDLNRCWNAIERKWTWKKCFFRRHFLRQSKRLGRRNADGGGFLKHRFLSYEFGFEWL